MGAKNSLDNEIRSGKITKEEKKLTILVISMLTVVIALYSIIPLAWNLT